MNTIPKNIYDVIITGISGIFTGYGNLFGQHFPEEVLLKKCNKTVIFYSHYIWYILVEILG